MTRLAVLLAVLVAACGARAQVPATHPAAPRSYVFPNALPDEIQVCVPQNDFVDEGYTCAELGNLRALLRRRLVA